MNEMKDKVQEMTTINFSITKCPLKIFKAFSDYCKKETNDNYAFGLKLLLDGMKGNAKELMLFEMCNELRNEIDLMKQVEEKVDEKKTPKTLGSGGLKNE